MELSTDNYRIQRDFHILLASSILILGIYGFQDLLFTTPSTVQNVQILQLDTLTQTNAFPVYEQNLVEFNGVVAYNQNTNLFILQTANGDEYIITSQFANFLELVGEQVTIGGALNGSTIEVSKVQVQ